MKHMYQKEVKSFIRDEILAAAVLQGGLIQWCVRICSTGRNRRHRHMIDMSVKELGCDGFEVDYHPFARPTHVFMGGKMFSYCSSVTIDGITYPSDTEALEPLRITAVCIFQMTLSTEYQNRDMTQNGLKSRRKRTLSL